MEHLAAATERTDCRVVIRGVDGSGKTTMLNRYIDTLDDEVSFATIDENCADSKQFYAAFLEQLGFNDITGSVRELRRITREFLIHRCLAGDPVLLIIDNAHLVPPSVFEQLRWISETKVEDRRVLSVVLAGSSDLDRVINSPAMSGAKFRRNVDFNIRACSEEETVAYIVHRLKLAGDVDSVKFSKGAHALIHRYSGGNPRVINRLCNSLLTEAHALHSRVIAEDLVRDVADSSQLLPHVVPLSKRGRRKTDLKSKQMVPDQTIEEFINQREAPFNTPAKKTSAGPTLPDADVIQLLEQVTMLSEQLGDLRSEANQALSEVDSRDEVIRELQQKVDALQDQIEELKTEADRALSEVDSRDEKISELQQKGAALQDQTGKLRDEKKQAERETTARTKDLNVLQRKFDAQIEMAKKQARLVAKEADEISRLKKALSDSKKEMGDARKALQKSERDSRKAARKAAADLKLANKRAAQADDLEKSNAALTEELESKTDQIDSLEKAVGEFEVRLQESTDERELLRVDEVAFKELETAVSEKDALIEALQAELAARAEVDTPTQAVLPEELDAQTSSSSKQGSNAAIEAFEVVRNGKIEQVLKVHECPPRIMIGRSEDSELCLDSKFVSRHHALIHCSGDGVHIEDLNSFNGTLVNSKKITRCALRPDDNVILGDCQIRPR
jgi:type II secretory pathway predicted ATPase ExeA